ncbi:hypothetical protein Tco_1381689 [Tanacetum coccineum]
MLKSSRVHGKRMPGLFGTDIRQERGGQVGRKTNKGRTNRLRFSESISRGLARSSSGSTSGIPNRLNSRSRARSSSTVSIGSIQNERIIETITRAFRQRIHKAWFLTLGSPGLVCQKEVWVIQDVHRLP